MKALLIASPRHTDMVSQVLRGRGFDVTVGQWRNGALNTPDESSFDLAVVDWALVGSDATDAIAPLREGPISIAHRLVVEVPLSDQVRVLTLGADDIMTAPLTRNRFDERIAVAISRTSPQSFARRSEAPRVEQSKSRDDGAESSLKSKLSDEEARLMTAGIAVRFSDLGRGPAHEFYKQAQLLVLDAIWKAEAERPLAVDVLLEAADHINTLLAGGHHELLLLATDRHQAYNVSSHCVNLAILATKMAQTLGWDKHSRRKIGLSALLHEVGVVLLPPRLIYRKSKIEKKELNELRRRPVFSGRILEKLGPDYPWLPEIVRSVFEREDGGGHPMGLTGDEMGKEATLLAIADVFEACIHIRPYRSALTGYQLLQDLTSGEARPFSDSLIRTLIQTFTFYPYNEHIVLNTGELGAVLDINADNLTRPVIVLLYDESGERLETPRKVRLDENPSLFITKAIRVDHLPC